MENFLSVSSFNQKICWEQFLTRVWTVDIDRTKNTCIFAFPTRYNGLNENITKLPLPALHYCIALRSLFNKTHYRDS